MAPEVDPVSWWNHHSTELPQWASAVCLVLLILPSSAETECACSLLDCSFGLNQDSALQDYIESSLMLQYNAQ